MSENEEATGYEEVIGKCILLLILAIIISVYLNTEMYYKSYNLSFFEKIVFFIFTLFFSFIGTTIGGLIRSFLGDVFTFSETIMGLFWKKIFFAIGFQVVGGFIGGLCGGGLAGKIFGYIQ